MSGCGPFLGELFSSPTEQGREFSQQGRGPCGLGEGDQDRQTWDQSQTGNLGDPRKGQGEDRGGYHTSLLSALSVPWLTLPRMFTRK